MDLKGNKKKKKSVKELPCQDSQMIKLYCIPPEFFKALGGKKNLPLLLEIKQRSALNFRTNLAWNKHLFERPHKFTHLREQFCGRDRVLNRRSFSFRYLSEALSWEFSKQGNEIQL